MRGHLSTIAAATLHAGVLLALVGRAQPSRTPVVEDAREADVDLELDTPTPSATIDPPAPAPTPTSEIAASLGATAPNAYAVEPTPRASEPSPTPLGSAAAAGSAAPFVFLQPSPSASPSFGPLAQNPFAIAAVREGAERGPPGPASTVFESARPKAPTAEEANRRARTMLSDGLAARDVAIGLGPGGPVTTALEEATRGSLAPERGSATFQAIVDATGLVVSLRLVGSTGGTDGWNDARDRAQRALATKRLALRGTKGAALTIVVESDVLLPSGAKPKAPITTPLTKSAVVLPENAPGNGTAGVTQTITVAEGDLSDVAGKPRRVVKSRVVSISTL